MVHGTRRSRRRQQPQQEVDEPPSSPPPPVEEVVEFIHPDDTGQAVLVQDDLTAHGVVVDGGLAVAAAEVAAAAEAAVVDVAAVTDVAAVNVNDVAAVADVGVVSSDQNQTHVLVQDASGVTVQEEVVHQAPDQVIDMGSVVFITLFWVILCEAEARHAFLLLTACDSAGGERHRGRCGYYGRVGGGR